MILGVQETCELWISYIRNKNLNFIYLPALFGFKALTFGLLKCHRVWCLMHKITKISSIHDGNNKRAYSIFHPLRVSSEEKCC